MNFGALFDLILSAALLVAGVVAALTWILIVFYLAMFVAGRAWTFGTLTATERFHRTKEGGES